MSFTELKGITKEELLQRLQEAFSLNKELKNNIPYHFDKKSVMGGGQEITYCPIKESTHGPLALVNTINQTRLQQGLSLLSWDTHPALPCKQELNAMNFEHVMKVVKQTLFSPSKTANIGANERFDLTKAIDDLFASAMKSYLEKLSDAVEKDDNEFQRIEREKVEKNSISWIRQGCCHRIRWFQDIDVLESSRLKTSQEHIWNRCKVLYEELVEFEDLVDSNKIGELIQLKKLHLGLFGNDFIPVGSTTLKIYLDEPN